MLRGNMSLDVASASALDGTEEKIALKKAIASQAQVDPSQVESVVVTVKVAGVVPLNVANAAAFVADAAASVALRKALATVNGAGVTSNDVAVTLEAATRRLSPAVARRLAANVNARFEITSAGGAEADATTAAMTGSTMAAGLATAINAELASSALEVASVEVITAQPTVDVSYTIRSDNATAAQAAGQAINALVPASMATAINSALTTAGSSFQVAGVGPIEAPNSSVEPAGVGPNSPPLQTTGTTAAPAQLQGVASKGRRSVGGVLGVAAAVASALSVIRK